MTGRRSVTPLGQQPAPPPPKATSERSRVNYLKTDSTRSTADTLIALWASPCRLRHRRPGRRRMPERWASISDFRIPCEAAAVRVASWL
jgi:hypothetical protein